MFIGWRGRVEVDPMTRGPVSREASDAVTTMPCVASAAARFGLSLGCWGVVTRPECSPVTSTVGLKVLPRCALPQSMLVLISDSIRAWERYRYVPSEVASETTVESSKATPAAGTLPGASPGVAHRHVCPATVGSTRMQPRKGCE